MTLPRLTPEQFTYVDTKANIEALTGLVGGERGYTTDTGEKGHYDAVGAAWDWGGGGGGAWGDITGTLADQADLQAELDAKEDTANKVTTMSGNTTSDIVFLTAKAIYDWAVELFSQIGHDHAASDITSDTMATARLGSGTANSSTFLRGDGAWVKQKLFLPFAQYIAINPISSDTVPYIATVDRTITFIQWSITLYVAGTNNGSNYWTVNLERETDGQVAASVNTSADSGSTYILKTVTTFSPTGYGSSDKAIRIHCVPTGSPSGLYAMGTTLEIEI